MAPTKPYDPVKALEGMFNGSVTRIAYALKDPANFAAPTKTVLTECAKRFHDALDDCEIQLLDAKWYLEHQLAQNKAQREALKARETGTATKRRHEEIEEANEAVVEDGTPSKRAKVVEADDNSERTKQITRPQTSEIQKAPKKAESPTATKQDAGLTQVEPRQEKLSQGKIDEAPPAQDDFAKPTPQATPAGTNDDFNFESMFGDPVVDSQENKDDDLGFSLNMGDTFDGNIEGGENPDSSALDSFLPGLETYANQSGDNPVANTTTDASGTLPAFNNDFDLPEIGGNAFDDFLNDESLVAGNYEGNVDLSEQGLLDLDFEDSFFG